MNKKKTIIGIPKDCCASRTEDAFIEMNIPIIIMKRPVARDVIEAQTIVKAG
jgi:hypothetical protein